MRPLRAALVGWLLAVVGAAAGCDAAQAPTGPPRCEPAAELELERQLKEAFRVLAEGDRESAMASFELVLSSEPDHPEAAFGLRLATRGDRVVRPTPRPALGEVVIGGERVPVPVPVNHERLRFEERTAQWTSEVARGLRPAVPPVPRWFVPRRDAVGVAVAQRDRYAVTEVIDLIVLHDSQTRTARDAFVLMGETGGSTHFYIDWDGTIYQTLDLGWEANHVKIAEVDRRSVAIDLVNPVELTEVPPLPPEARDLGVTRPLSEFVYVQGVEVQAWGYTEAQMASLEQLVATLTRLLPRVPKQVPRARDGSNQIPRAFLGAGGPFTGVVGHVHLFPRAGDPGPGFDWERMARSLR